MHSIIVEAPRLLLIAEYNGGSEARNRVVAHDFKELNLIKQWKSEINRIQTNIKHAETDGFL